MKRRNGLTIAALVLLLSASALASSIPDPGGIIRRGSDYTGGVAIIEPGLILTFDDETVTSFDPFHAGFCHATEGGPECDFENKSGQTILDLNQVFANTFAPGFLSCVNDVNPEGGCNTGPGNHLIFYGLHIFSPPPVEEYSSILADDLNTDPDFNITYFGFTDNGLADVANTDFFAPEPASLGLMVSGMLGLGLAWKRKTRAKTR